MSAVALQEALANEVLEHSHMFRQNAALNRGLPSCSPAQTVSLPDEKPAPPAPPIVHVYTPEASTATATSLQGATGAAPTASRSLLKAAAPWLLTAAGAGGLAAGANYFMKDKPPAPVVQPADKDGDLLQYLQSRGAHLPEGWPQ